MHFIGFCSQLLLHNGRQCDGFDGRQCRITQQKKKKKKKKQFNALIYAIDVTTFITLIELIFKRAFKTLKNQ